MSVPLRVAITGASGLVGRAFRRTFAAPGQEIISLVRRPAGRDEVRWDPSGPWDARALDGIDAVIHLAGAGIADRRWSTARKRELRRSRVEGTRSLVDAISALPHPPKALLSASAMGYYGDGGDTALDETAPPGGDFLGQLAVDWEAEARRAEGAGIRVALLRFGLILSPDGGALGKMLLPFKLGLGGRLGSGRQWMSWILLDDLMRLLCVAVIDDRYRGAINAVSPAPVTNAEFTATLGRVLGRPTIFPVPATALRLLLGEMAGATLLAGQRLVPARLNALDFEWRRPTLEGALRELLGR